MDPTFASHARTWFTAVDREHHIVTSDEASANATLVAGRCSCGDELAFGRAEHLLDVLASSVAEPAVAPHVIHVASRFAKQPDQTVQSEDDPEAGDPRPKGTTVTGRRYVGPIDCPDCGRGLVSRGHDMICSRLDRELALRGCHEGCVVACGVSGG